MITTFFLYVIAVILKIPYYLLSTIPWVVPDFLIDGVTYVFSSMALLQGELPLVADPDLTGLAAQFGILDILIFWYQAMFWYFFIKLLFAMTSKWTGFTLNKVKN